MASLRRPSLLLCSSFSVFSDPGAPDAASAKGMISLSFGKLFEKVWSMWEVYFIGQALTQTCRVFLLPQVSAMLRHITDTCET
jgi:hypothetical protein